MFLQACYSKLIHDQVVYRVFARAVIGLGKEIQKKTITPISEWLTSFPGICEVKHVCTS